MWPTDTVYQRSHGIKNERQRNNGKSEDVTKSPRGGDGERGVEQVVFRNTSLPLINVCGSFSAGILGQTGVPSCSLPNLTVGVRNATLEFALRAVPHELFTE